MKQSKGVIVGILVAVIIVVVGFVLLLGGKKNTTPNTTSNSSSSTASNAVATDTVTIENYAFSPATITVKVGTKVTWTNKDSVHHSVVADTSSNDAPNAALFGQNETFNFTFSKAGTYPYHCGAHPDMHGTVIVTN